MHHHLFQEFKAVHDWHINIQKNNVGPLIILQQKTERKFCI